MPSLDKYFNTERSANDLPARVERLLGIKLTDFQRHAIELVERSEDNLLVVAPTGTGKTIIGYAALLKYGGGFYLAPLIAIMNEKYHELSELGKKVGMTVVITNRDYRIPFSVVLKSNIKVMSPYKFLTYAQHLDPQKHGRVVVVDEFHKLSKDALFEAAITLAKLKGFRIIALSATISDEDAEKLAEWLNAKLVTETKRPVELKHVPLTFYFTENKYVSAKLVRVDGKPIINQYEVFDDHEEIAATVAARLYKATRRPVIVWAPTRSKVENIAVRIAAMIEEDEKFAALAEKIPSSNPSEKVLKYTLKHGVWIHHGGLSYSVRSFVEENYRKHGGIIVTAYTLSHGVNIPGTFLIISSIYDYEMKPLDPSTFHQIAGRAGRPGLDSIGVVFTVVVGDAEYAYYKKLLSTKATRITPALFSDEVAVVKLLLPLYIAGHNINDVIASTYTYFISRDEKSAEQARRYIEEIVEEYRKLGNNKGVIEAMKMGLHPKEYRAIMSVLTEDQQYTAYIEALLNAVCEIYRMECSEVYEDIIKYGFLSVWFGSNPKSRDAADKIQTLLETASFWAAKVYGWNSKEHQKLVDLAKRFAYGGNPNVEPLAKAVRIEVLRRIIKAVPQIVGGASTESEALQLTVTALKEAFLHRKRVKKDEIMRLATLIYKALTGSSPSAETLGKIYSEARKAIEADIV